MSGKKNPVRHFAEWVGVGDWTVTYIAVMVTLELVLQVIQSL